MNSYAQDRLLKQINKLVVEVEAVLETKFSTSRGSYVDLRDPRVEAQPFRKWVTSCRNLLHQIGNPAHV